MVVGGWATYVAPNRKESLLRTQFIITASFFLSQSSSGPGPGSVTDSMSLVPEPLTVHVITQGDLALLVNIHWELSNIKCVSTTVILVHICTQAGNKKDMPLIT